MKNSVTLKMSMVPDLWFLFLWECLKRNKTKQNNSTTNKHFTGQIGLPVKWAKQLGSKNSFHVSEDICGNNSKINHQRKKELLKTQSRFCRVPGASWEWEPRLSSDWRWHYFWHFPPYQTLKVHIQTLRSSLHRYLLPVWPFLSLLSSWVTERLSHSTSSQPQEKFPEIKCFITWHYIITMCSIGAPTYPGEHHW